MKLVLASTWHPRGEQERLLKLTETLRQVYSTMVIIVPPDKQSSVVEIFKSAEQDVPTDIYVGQPEIWSQGRYHALQQALSADATHIHYADLDRLLRWVETRKAEWRNTCERIIETECLIIGRTTTAYFTHPKALLQTEAISNQVVSYFLNRSLDVSAGSKGFSRRAAEYIVNHTSAGHALGTDAEWPIVLSKAGFQIDYIEVEGLDWENADRYLQNAAAKQDQAQAAVLYDQDPENWAHRVQVAHEIVATALKAAQQP